MKVSQAIEQLYSRLPFLTDKFSQKVNISSIVFSGMEAAVTTSTSHGLEILDFFTITGLYAPISISSITRVGEILTVVTDSPHDLTNDFQKNVILSGSIESEFNGVFALRSVIDSLNFTLDTVDSGSVSATGSPILEQKTGNLYNQIVGYKQVSEATTANSFTFALETPLSATIIGLGVVAVGYRITGAVSFESALDMYTKNSDNEYWAFVVSNSNVASKDRKNNSDSIYSYNGNTGYKQEINQTFSVYVFATVSDEIDAYNIKDDMQDVSVYLVNSLCGAKFDNGFAVGNYYSNVFDTHLTQFYNKAIYAHSFIFQTTTQIVNEDIFNPSVDVAFRTINLSMDVVVRSMEIKPDTDKMTVLDIKLGEE